MFDIPNVISWGSFVIPINIITFGVIGYVTTFLVSVKGKSLAVNHQVWLDIFIKGLLFYLLVWKFSFILLDPFLVFKNPGVILIGNGGYIGSIIGIIVGLFVIFKAVKEKGIPFFLFLDLFLYWLLITLTIFWLVFPNYGHITTLPWGVSVENTAFTYHPVHVYRFLIGALTFLFLKKIQLGTGTYSFKMLSVLGLGLLIISNFSFQRISILGLSEIQWLYLTMTSVGLIGITVLGKNSDNRSEHQEELKEHT